MILRDYQQKAVADIRAHFEQRKKSVLLTLPTGGGKTATVSYMFKQAHERGHHSCFFVHRKELIEQAASAFEKFKIPYGIIASGYTGNPTAKVQIASIHTYKHRMKNYKPFTFCGWDEAHHNEATTWQMAMEYNRSAYHVGLTATPERLDGKGLENSFQAMVIGPTVKDLIGAGHLSQYKYYAPSKMDLSHVKKYLGDYKKTEVEEEIKKQAIVGSAVSEYLKLCPGKRAVVFCVSVLNSLDTCSQFIKAGVPAAHIDAQTPAKQRAQTIEQFKNGSIKILCNVDLVGEGFDLPAIEVAILMRPTTSLGLYLQQVGRALRPYEGKEHAIILDHVGNYERHGMPCADRQWSLKGHAAKAQASQSEVSIKMCPKCFFVQLPATHCQNCGSEFPVQAPKEIEQVDGSLEEIKAAQVAEKKAKKREQGQARTLEALVELGRARGYKNPQAWAYFVYNSRGRG